MASRLNKTKTVQAARRAQKSQPAKPTRARSVARPKSSRSAARLSADDAVMPIARRIRRVALVFALAAFALVFQAARLQLWEHRRLATIAARQTTARAQVRAKRGAIRDRNGDELAISVDLDSVFFEWSKGAERATPDQVRTLARLLRRPQEVLAKKLASRRTFVYLARRVDASTAAAVRKLGIAGLGTKREPKRFYANARLGAHVLGFTNVDGEGRAGIERRYDEQLRGREQTVTGLRDAFGTPIFSRGAIAQSALRGAAIELTIDRHIQYATEQALAEAVKTHRAKSGVALLMEPATGDILALASYPRFNPNNLRDTTVFQRTNRAVNAVFEPGSTLKMVTVAAALEEGLIHPKTRLNCEDGQWSVGNDVIHDADHRFGTLSVTEIIQKSSNICAAKLGFRLGRQRLHGWLGKFGFGARTGVELPGELRGLIRPPERWSPIGLANIAFGQGISATPMQILQAASIVANNGRHVAPRLVRATVGADGVRHETAPVSPVRVLRANTARSLMKMMTAVTEEGGTAPYAAIPGFQVAGKTGTAQKIDPVTRAYSHKLFVASFAGFVPAKNPRLVGLVLIDEPQGSMYGGVVAAPAWQKMTVAALSTLGLRPQDRAAWAAFAASQARIPTPPEPAQPEEAVHGQAALRTDDGPPPTDEAPNLAAAFDLPLSEAAKRLLGRDAPEAKTLGQTNKDRMPNFARLTMHEVLNRATATRCDLVVEGTGRVIRQRPQAGMPLAPDARCELTLAPPR
ncbi:MAG: penicillin-binding transpeptidase domain-containing protein [Myxococcota bacterium]